MKAIKLYLLIGSILLVPFTSVKAESFKLFLETPNYNFSESDIVAKGSNEQLYAQGKYNSGIGKHVAKKSTVSLALFDEVTNYKINSVSRKKDHRVSYSGSSENNSTLSIAENNGRIVGSLQHDGKLYKLRPSKNGDTLIIEVKKEGLIDHSEAYSENSFQVNPNELTNYDNATNSAAEFTVIVAYTSNFSSDAGDVAAYMDLLELETNTSYSNSQVNTSVKIVHYYQTSYSDSGDFYIDRSYFTNSSNSEVAELHSLREQYNADIMILLTGNTGYSFCGLANDIGATADNAIAFAREGCATGYYSFGHEIGHLFGARHIITKDSNTTPYAYGHGYCNVTPSTWRTVMAYDCPTNTGGPRIQQWSNPYISISSEPTGTVSQEYNAQVMNVRANTVANFRVDDGGDDDYEENDTLATAYDHSSNERIWLSNLSGLGIQTDDDWYKISVTSDYTRIVVDLQFTHADGDIDISLKNTSGTTLVSSYSSTDNEYIDYIVPSGGTYYLKVYYWGTTGNTYDMWWDDYRPISAPSPADGATVNAGSNGQLLSIYAPGASDGTIYYDDDSVFIDWSTPAVKNGNYLEAVIPYALGKMNDDGVNYWYVKATDSGTGDTLRYPAGTTN